MILDWLLISVCSGYLMVSVSIYINVNVTRSLKRNMFADSALVSGF